MKEENEKMLEIINNSRLREKYSYWCMTPNIPDALQKRLLIKIDDTFPLNRLLAFFGKSKNCKEGIVFTNDGIYQSKDKKTFYIHYSDMKEVTIKDSSSLIIHTSDGQIRSVSTDIPSDEFKNILMQLKMIDEKYGHAAMKKTGFVKGMSLPKDKVIKVNAVIHVAAILCGLIGAGFAQIPFSDRYILMAIQIVMIVIIGKIMKSKLKATAIIAIVCVGATSYFGKGLCKIILGWIPGAGNVVNAIVALGITELIAWIVFAFERGFLQDARIEALKKIEEVSEKFEEKLHKQAQEFIKQVKNVKREKKEYADLLNEYEAYIKLLEHNGEDKRRIEEMKQQYSELVNLK